MRKSIGNRQVRLICLKKIHNHQPWFFNKHHCVVDKEFNDVKFCARQMSNLRGQLACACWTKNLATGFTVVARVTDYIHHGYKAYFMLLHMPDIVDKKVSGEPRSHPRGSSLRKLLELWKAPGFFLLGKNIIYLTKECYDKDTTRDSLCLASEY